MSSLESKVESLTATNALMSEDLAIAKAAAARAQQAGSQPANKANTKDRLGAKAITAAKVIKNLTLTLKK